MNPDVANILKEAEELIERLRQPLTEDMCAGGWREQTAHAMSEGLVGFVAKIRVLDDLPPKSERPWNMVRILDFNGIHSGGPYPDLISFGEKLK